MIDETAGGRWTDEICACVCVCVCETISVVVTPVQVPQRVNASVAPDDTTLALYSSLMMHVGRAQ